MWLASRYEDEDSEGKARAAQILRAVAERPERRIALVTHHNVIQVLAARTPQEIPMHSRESRMRLQPMQLPSITAAPPS